MDERNLEVLRGKAPAWPVLDGGSVGRAHRVAPEPDAPFGANTRALEACRLNPRVLHTVKEPSLGVNVLGLDLSMPVVAAPLCAAYREAGAGYSEAGAALALVAGCAARGVAAGVGDGYDDSVFDAGLDVLRRTRGGGLCFVKPWEGPTLERRLELAQAAGAAVLGVDADAVGLPVADGAERPLAPLAPARLARIAKRASLPLVVRGVMTPDEARIAVEAGAAGVVVSNRGGRALGQCPGVAEVLPWIVEAVHGQAAILAEGGVRTGVDVLKMLALGADAVMIGGGIEVAARGGGMAAVEECLDRLRLELAQAMRLTGTPRAAAVQRGVLYVHP
jgi:isopentenyl diphosphate isomerase/L-lactate dehydrogenase-like FMN-dependent dehydrogenase